jgi:hypothetical protein
MARKSGASVIYSRSEALRRDIRCGLMRIPRRVLSDPAATREDYLT